MNALRRIHAALVPGGLVVDTQPVSAHPPVESDAAMLGALDMREWAQQIADIDALADEAFDAGLFALEGDSCFVVTDEYDDGAEFLSYARNWVGTRIGAGLERRAAAEPRPVRIHQDVRLRLLRRL